MEKDLELLNKVFKATEIGSKGLNVILPKVVNKGFRKAIINQISEYDKINSLAKSEISNLGKKAPKNTLQSLTNEIGIKLNTSLDSSDSHVAKIIINGSNSDIISITETLNKSTDSTPKCYNIGRALVKNEKENIEIMKNFL